MDFVLVPCGLAIMLGYHLLLLYRILRHPHTTVIGYENHNKLAWVQRMVQVEDTCSLLLLLIDPVSFFSFLRSVPVLLADRRGSCLPADDGAGGGGPGAERDLRQHLGVHHAGVALHRAGLADRRVGEQQRRALGAAHGRRRPSLLVCFLASFACFIQSAGHYVHASFLMTALGSDAPASHVQRAVIRGGNFWALGLRALYFATALLMWVFGPVAMLACSVLTVVVLHLLDTSSMPLHHHQFLDRTSGTGGTRAASAPNPGLHSAVAVFSPVPYLR
ncbi:hypothetical protein TRIUR3_16565 [Triticum urartu]|uniref:Uncharacterized protein n=1 Tax=Triticum urartu TaxID=4572 RepID=M7ZZ39_TRIUA|nr:hypothetical protein TRIUR3_16565 [Triticum urartu]